MTIRRRGKGRRGAIRSAQVIHGPELGQSDAAKGDTRAPVVDVIDEYGQTWNDCKLLMPGGGRAGAYFPPSSPLSSKVTFDKSSGSEVVLCFGDGLKPQPVVMGAFMHPTLSKKRFRKKAAEITGADHSKLDSKINVDDTIIPGLGGGRLVLGGNTDARVEIDTRFTGTAKKKGRPIYLHVGGDISEEGHASNVVITQSNIRAYDRLLLAHSTGILIEKMCAKIDQLEATVTALYNWARNMHVSAPGYDDTTGFIQFRAGTPAGGDAAGWAPASEPSLVIPRFDADSWCNPGGTTEGKRVENLGAMLPRPNLAGIGSDSGLMSPSIGASKGTGKYTGFSPVPLKQFPAMTMRGHAKDHKGYPSSSDYNSLTYWKDRSKTTGAGQYLRFWTDKSGDLILDTTKAKKAYWYEWDGKAYMLHRELSRLCVSNIIRISPNSLWSEDHKLPSGVPHRSGQVVLDLNSAPLTNALTGGKYWTKDNYKTGGN